jgi:hypothetical protein
MIISIILSVVAAAILILVVVIALQPADFQITRSAEIAAPAPIVFDQVNDFQKWTAWSPWEGLDPALKRTYSGTPAGTGTIYNWVGNSKVGEGRMEITESRPSDLIRIKLDFIKPFKATNATEFTFVPKGNQTATTWTMTGRKSFPAKAFGLFMNMDKLVGGDFEKGLTKMKAVAETATANQPC